MGAVHVLVRLLLLLRVALGVLPGGILDGLLAHDVGDALGHADAAQGGGVADARIRLDRSVRDGGGKEKREGEDGGAKGAERRCHDASR